MTITTNTITYYILEAECLDNKKNHVKRYLGMVRGMSDNGQPGWSPYPDSFHSLDDVKECAKFPHSYNVYDGNYIGGRISILQITKKTTIDTSEVVISTIVEG